MVSKNDFLMVVSHYRFSDFSEYRFVKFSNGRTGKAFHIYFSSHPSDFIHSPGNDIGIVMKSLSNGAAYDVVFLRSQSHEMISAQDIDQTTDSKDKYHYAYLEKCNEDTKAYLESRKVDYFVHFTDIENIPQILKGGLRPVSQQHEKGRATDHQRFDNQLEATSLSISFPNYRMFYNKRKSMPNTRFAILFINIDVMESILDSNIGYYQENAASKVSSTSSFSDHFGLAKLKMLFDDIDSVRSRYNTPSFVTTNPQSEILVRETIMPDYIDYICVEDSKTKADLRNLVGDNPIKIVVDNTCFQSRPDYKEWR